MTNSRLMSKEEDCVRCDDPAHKDRRSSGRSEGSFRELHTTSVLSLSGSERFPTRNARHVSIGGICMNIFVAGVHGVGKTFLASQLPKALGLMQTSASKLIKEERALPDWGRTNGSVMWTPIR